MTTISPRRPSAAASAPRSPHRRRRLLAGLLLLIAGLAVLGGFAVVNLIAAAGSPGASVDLSADRSGAFDRNDPMIGGLDAELFDALQRAADDAARDGVTMQITSGWRSAAEQEQLLQDAVAEYGSLDEASRWVATPETSAHVSGDAVDIGDFAAAVWLGDKGARYGLCRVYDNEPWHLELRPDAVTEGCPDVYWDPTYDPRMQG